MILKGVNGHPLRMRVQTHGITIAVCALPTSDTTATTDTT